MARVLNFGSINVDHVYRVDHFVQPGETLDSRGYARFAGGKGLNQSIALARAGATVFHAGMLGRDGLWLKDLLNTCGVNTEHVATIEGPGGHAIIQVNTAGENAIVIHGGANRQIGEPDADRVLAQFGPGDFLLVQNEVSSVPHILRAARSRGLTTVFNPAPMTDTVLSYPLDTVDILIVNETEGRHLSGQADPDAICATLRRRFPPVTVVLTLGKDGALYADPRAQRRQAAFPAQAVDTTAAGDTFIGFFLAEWIRSRDAAAALALACKAASICVTRPGAADSIPRRQEVQL